MVGNGYTSKDKDSAKFRPVFNVLAIVLLLATLLVAGTQPARAGGALVVNTTNDGHDATPGDGFCATASGGCSLRAAIEEANAFPGADQIIFGLPGGGTHVMSITLGALPAITDVVVIDGTSQPMCAAPCIVISGASVGGAGNGFTLHASNSLIKGFIITSWTKSRGILIVGDENEIQKNDIGFWPGNPALLPNGTGISIFGAKNRIGGGSAAERNVVSGNTAKGIDIANGCCAIYTSNTIQGNFIGTNAAGSAPLGNHQTGVQVLSHATNTAIVNNVISSNLFWGIELASATDTSISGNKIGTNAAGTGALGNRLGGIVIDTGAMDNTIGPAGPGSTIPNLIAFNLGPGVAVINTPTINNRITANSIFSNGGLGIDLAATGVTPNDLRDPDRGPNMIQNFPLLRTATSATHIITGMLNSRPSQTFALEFFASPAGSCDPSSYGEGKKLIAMITIVTDAAGNASFSLSAVVAFPAGAVITATATDVNGNTSEFSRCLVAK